MPFGVRNSSTVSIAVQTLSASTGIACVWAHEFDGRLSLDLRLGCRLFDTLHCRRVFRTPPHAPLVAPVVIFPTPVPLFFYHTARNVGLLYLCINASGFFFPVARLCLCNLRWPDPIQQENMAYITSMSPFSDPTFPPSYLPVYALTTPPSSPTLKYSERSTKGFSGGFSRSCKMKVYAEDPGVCSRDEILSCAARDSGRDPLRDRVSSGPRMMSRHPSSYCPPPRLPVSVPKTDASPVRR